MASGPADAGSWPSSSPPSDLHASVDVSSDFLCCPLFFSKSAK